MRWVMLLMPGSLKRKGWSSVDRIEVSSHEASIIFSSTTGFTCGQCDKLDNFHKTGNVLFPRFSILLFVVFPVSLILSCLVGKRGRLVARSDGKEELGGRGAKRKKEGKSAKRQLYCTIVVLTVYWQFSWSWLNLLVDKLCCFEVSIISPTNLLCEQVRG